MIVQYERVGFTHQLPSLLSEQEQILRTWLCRLGREECETAANRWLIYLKFLRLYLFIIAYHLEGPGHYDHRQHKDNSLLSDRLRFISGENNPPLDWWQGSRVFARPCPVSTSCFLIVFKNKRQFIFSLRAVEFVPPFLWVVRTMLNPSNGPSTRLCVTFQSSYYCLFLLSILNWFMFYSVPSSSHWWTHEMFITF